PSGLTARGPDRRRRFPLHGRATRRRDPSRSARRRRSRRQSSAISCHRRATIAASRRNPFCFAEDWPAAKTMLDQPLREMADTTTPAGPGLPAELLLELPCVGDEKVLVACTPWPEGGFQRSPGQTFDLAEHPENADGVVGS